MAYLTLGLINTTGGWGAGVVVVGVGVGVGGGSIFTISVELVGLTDL